MVRTVTRKLEIDQTAKHADETGGSTYHLTLHRGHPFEEEALGELRRFRERLSALRERIDRYNAEHGMPAVRLRVDTYFGQSVVEEESDQNDDEDL